MSDADDQIKFLNEKLSELIKKHNESTKAIRELREELNLIATKQQAKKILDKAPPKEIIKETVKSDVTNKTTSDASAKSDVSEPIKTQIHQPTKKIKNPSAFEKFIGENLINKIGIGITIIGVGVGAKYAIDHQLINPLTRIILGYLLGLGLLGFALKLKKNYENFSAVLLGGAMAIMYFITFASYSYYALISQTVAFILMVMFTIFTVLSSLSYNRQIIAHIGLVGAYAIPFLLSENSGKVEILFSYMTIINIGILIVAYYRNWKSLIYVSFSLTWLIFVSWYVIQYNYTSHQPIAWIFLSIYFATFYFIIVGEKVIRRKNIDVGDVLLLMPNAFIFFGVGIALLKQHNYESEYLGLFTLFNSLIHFTVGLIVYKRKLAEKHLLNLIIGLVLIFLTLTFMVQFDGNWVTIFWIGEATLLFWLGRTRGIAIYEKISYVLMVITLFSLIQDWSLSYSKALSHSGTKFVPVFNLNFIASIMVIAGYSIIHFINRIRKYNGAFNASPNLSNVAFYLILGTIVITTYLTFTLEINAFWYNKYLNSKVVETTATDSFGYNYYNHDYRYYGAVWVINFSLLFLVVFGIINYIKMKNEKFKIINLILISFTMLIFLTIGQNNLSRLSASFLYKPDSTYFNYSEMNIVIRYISYLFVVFSLILFHLYKKMDFLKNQIKIAFDFVLHTTIIWILSSELIHWSKFALYTDAYKFGLSILWGTYALILIIIGIWKKKRHIRFGAIGLFGITLIKLFAYDITNLNTIAKTFVFVSLGILLLIISFLYNKYKHIISDDTN